MATTPVVTPKQQLRPLTEFNNAQILNMIRNEASPEYQRRMPSATQMNMDRQMATLMSSTQLKNEFYSALVNRIGGTYVNTWRWNNPLSVFQRALTSLGRNALGDELLEAETAAEEALEELRRRHRRRGGHVGHNIAHAPPGAQRRRVPGLRRRQRLQVADEGLAFGAHEVPDLHTHDRGFAATRAALTNYPTRRVAVR